MCDKNINVRSRKTENIDEILFFIAYMTWMVYGLLLLTKFRDMIPRAVLSEYIYKLIFLLTVFQIMVDIPTKRREIAGIIFLIFAWGAGCYAGYPQMFLVYCLLFSARKVELKKIFKVSFALQVTILLVTILASCGGIIANEVWMDGNGIRVRYALGFRFCSYPSQLLFFITLLYIVIRKKINLLEALVLTLLNYGMYRLTVTRTDILLSVLAIWVAFVWCRISGPLKGNVIRKICTRYLIFFAYLVSILAQYFYDPENAVFLKINTLLSGRLNLGHNAMHTYGIRLFGQYVEWIGATRTRANPNLVYNFVDNAYLKLTINYGLIFVIILMIMFSMAMEWAAQKENRALCLAMAAVVGYALINVELDNLFYNTMLLVLSRVFLMEEDGGLQMHPRGMMFRKNLKDRICIQEKKADG